MHTNKQDAKRTALFIMKTVRCCAYILALAGAILSAADLLVYPFKYIWLLFAALGLAVSLCLVWINKRGLWPTVLKTILLACCICICILVMLRCLGNPPRSYEYDSPNGENTVIVEYDMRGAPHLFVKHNWLFKTNIPLDNVSYMEEVTFDIIWHSESRFTMDLGLYKGALEKFEVDLTSGESEFYSVRVEERQEQRIAAREEVTDGEALNT